MKELIVLSTFCFDERDINRWANALLSKGVFDWMANCSIDATSYDGYDNATQTSLDHPRTRSLRFVWSALGTIMPLNQLD